MRVELLACVGLCIRLRAGLCIELYVGLLISVGASGRIELLWTIFRRAPRFARCAQRKSRARARSRRQGGPDLRGRGALERVQPLFLIERDGEQDGFHRVVARLICGCLCVGAHAAKQTVEIFLILAAQRAAEFRPARDGVVDQLPECGYCAAHGFP